MGVNKRKTENILEELLDTIKNLKLEIELLKQEVRNNNQMYFPPLQDFNTDRCADGGEHEYPNPWFGVVPPYCKKCGKQAPINEIRYNDNGTGKPPWDFNKYGGNVMSSENKTLNNSYIKDSSRLF